MLSAICLLSCSSDIPDKKNQKPPQTVGGVGGFIGNGGAGGCDPWVDYNCCVHSKYCPDTACVVDAQLCAGECVGNPNPVSNTPCDGGICSGIECVETGGAGGMGTAGSGGAGGN